MVLSGTLREFILADVLQLLTQQKITGNLILSSGKEEGCIVFRNGNIVSASKGNETFSKLLFNYLVTVQQQQKNKVRELFSTYESKTAELTIYLENKNILTHEELESYATSVTLDIACSLFLWTSGQYRFDSLRSVDHLVPAGIEIPVENVIMEAMRRIDEWHRMREAITEETIFVQTDNEAGFQQFSSPSDDPSSWFYNMIDGTSEVRNLLKNAIFTDYKVYETLYFLYQEDLIRPLSDSITQSIHAAILKKEEESQTTILQPLSTLLISTGLILLAILFSWLHRGAIFSQLNISSSIRKSEIDLLTAEEHYNDARRYFAVNSLNFNEGELSSYSLITKKDKHLLSLKKKLGQSGY
jgi:hypothetical protein